MESTAFLFIIYHWPFYYKEIFYLFVCMFLNVLCGSMWRIAHVFVWMTMFACVCRVLRLMSWVFWDGSAPYLLNHTETNWSLTSAFRVLSYKRSPCLPGTEYLKFWSLYLLEQAFAHLTISLVLFPLFLISFRSKKNWPEKLCCTG